MMSTETNQNGSSRDPEMERYYEAMRPMGTFNLERQGVLDPLTSYLRDITRTELLPYGVDLEMGLELREAETLSEIMQSFARMFPVLDTDGMELADREKFLQHITDWAQENRERIDAIPATKDYLIRANLRLVVNIARRYYKSAGLPLDDRIQEGSIGLIHAVDKYNGRFNLSTYATWWIKQKIARATEEEKSIHIPIHVLRKWRSVCTRFRKENGRNPNDQELLELGFTELQLQEVQRALRLIRLSAAWDEDEEKSLDANIEDDWIARPGDALEEQDETVRIYRALEKLDPRERMIVRERFGLHEGMSRGDKRTLQQIGDVLGVTRERVRQLEARAFEKMRLLVGLDLALNDPLRPNQLLQEKEVRQKALQLSKVELDFVPGFIVRKLLANDGRKHSWEDIASSLEIPVEQVKTMGEKAIEDLRRLFLGEVLKKAETEDDAPTEITEEGADIQDDRKEARTENREVIDERQQRVRQKSAKQEKLIQKTRLELIMDSDNSNGAVDLKKRVKKAIVRLLPFMPPLRYTIVTKRFGLNGEMVHSIEQIATILDRKSTVIAGQFTVVCHEIEAQFESESWWKQIQH